MSNHNFFSGPSNALLFAIFKPDMILLASMEKRKNGRHDTQHDDIQHNVTQHIGFVCDTRQSDTTIVIMLSVAFKLLLC
jgi:hypothetical protein